MAKASAQSKHAAPALSSQAYLLAVITLIAGIGIGWLLRGSSSTPESAAANAPASTAPSFQVPSFNQPTGKLSADAVSHAAAPMLAQLQQRPNDADLLAKIGNLYYDSQIYPQAIEYYQRSLKARPTDPDVRTDMGTAMWYSGDADGALKEFQTSLTYNATHNGTLFNRGVVLLQGKNDPKGAIASWEQLLKVNPNYPDRAKVEGLIAQAKQQKSS
jgi:tetratricopeptide (TPR) repeat protein